MKVTWEGINNLYPPPRRKKPNFYYQNYLTHKKQTTSNGSYSETTLCGVPHGFVLSRLLFLSYVNKIANSSKHLFFLSIC